MGNSATYCIVTDYRKLRSLFVSFCLVKSIGINMEVSIYHALYAILKSSFYPLSFTNTEYKTI
jgi:hypothetical protein